MFFAFLPTGPINTLLLESVPVSLRARAMAVSIFVIHLFGDFWSPVIVGNLADWGYQADNPGASLQDAMLILPAVFSLSILSWGWLALRQRRREHAPPRAANCHRGRHFLRVSLSRLGEARAGIHKEAGLQYVTIPR